jgi:sec-independent protein translocase protein TatA
MGSLSAWHWIIVLTVVLIVFGAGKLPSVAGDLAKGIKAFKAGMRDEEAPAPAAPREVERQGAPAPAAPPASSQATPSQAAPQAAPQAAGDHTPRS